MAAAGRPRAGPSPTARRLQGNRGHGRHRAVAATPQPLPVSLRAGEPQQHEERVTGRGMGGGALPAIAPIGVFRLADQPFHIQAIVSTCRRMAAAAASSGKSVSRPKSRPCRGGRSASISRSAWRSVLIPARSRRACAAVSGRSDRGGSASLTRVLCRLGTSGGSHGRRRGRPSRGCPPPGGRPGLPAPTRRGVRVEPAHPPHCCGRRTRPRGRHPADGAAAARPVAQPARER